MSTAREPLLSDDDWQAIADESGQIIWSGIRRAVDARLAAIQQPREGALTGWLPIETAPKDMAARLFLVGGVCVQGFIDATAMYCVQDDRYAWRRMKGRPTHWMPLQTPPGITSTPTGDSNGN